MSASYQIFDEPAAGRGRGLVVEPFWALLAVMLAGAWLGGALFAVNAWFLRGPHWRRELALTLALLAGGAVLYLLVAAAGESGLIPEPGMKYALLSITLWKLSLAYWIFFLQQTGFDLYEYFGGKAQNGLPIVIVGSFLIDRWVMGAVDNPLWRAMVS